MIQEVIVVEGRSDVAAIRNSIEADCLITGGFSLSPELIAQIEAAYRRRGIIILTDPDSAGERIRTYLRERFPQAKHAFVPRASAIGQDGRIGVEKASPSEIRAALEKIRTAETDARQEFMMEDILSAGLSGTESASDKRAFLGGELGIGWANAKTFLHRLNTYGVTRGEFVAALKKWEAMNDKSDHCGT